MGGLVARKFLVKNESLLAETAHRNWPLPRRIAFHRLQGCRHRLELLDLRGCFCFFARFSSSSRRAWIVGSSAISGVDALTLFYKTKGAAFQQRLVRIKDQCYL